MLIFFPIFCLARPSAELQFRAVATLNKYMDRLNMLRLFVIIFVYFQVKVKFATQSTAYESPKNFNSPANWLHFLNFLCTPAWGLVDLTDNAILKYSLTTTTTRSLGHKVN